MAASEDLDVHFSESVYLTSEKSGNTLWEVRKVLGDEIQLRNPLTTRFLFRKKNGDIHTSSLKWGNGTSWTMVKSIEQSSQISLKSSMNDFLNSGKDK